jgi:gamma-glutamyltranspeptidase / glutathione hydrolase
MLFSALLVAVSALSTAVSAHPKTAAGEGKVGAVASESAVCSNIGIDVLKASGNAADAVR